MTSERTPPFPQPTSVTAGIMIVVIATMVGRAETQELPVHARRTSADARHLPRIITGRGRAVPVSRGARPYDLATGSIHARKRCIQLVSSVEPVQKAVAADGGVEVQRKILRRPDDPEREVRPHVKQRAARAIAGRHEHLVVEHYGTRRRCRERGCSQVASRGDCRFSAEACSTSFRTRATCSRGRARGCAATT